MKLRLPMNQNSTLLPISKHEVVHPSETPRNDIYQHYEHPWYKYQFTSSEILKKPNPPTKEAVEKAKFVDKTYQWTPKQKKP